MLVLTRHEGESVKLANGMITVTLLEIKGDKVRLGFDCPRDIDIHREEVFVRIQQKEKGDGDER